MEQEHRLSTEDWNEREGSFSDEREGRKPPDESERKTERRDETGRLTVHKIRTKQKTMTKQRKSMTKALKHIV